jgi:hypothetical protein
VEIVSPQPVSAEEEHEVELVGGGV